MATAALFLASDESSYVTGSTFNVDGGITAAYVAHFFSPLVAVVTVATHVCACLQLRNAGMSWNASVQHAQCAQSCAGRRQSTNTRACSTTHDSALRTTSPRSVAHSLLRDCPVEICPIVVGQRRLVSRCGDPSKQRRGAEANPCV